VFSGSAGRSGFCEARGEKPGNQRRFRAALEDKGFSYKRTMEARIFEGLKLAPTSFKMGNDDAGTPAF
jgi:hypothetical protein